MSCKFESNVEGGQFNKFNLPRLVDFLMLTQQRPCLLKNNIFSVSIHVVIGNTGKFVSQREGRNTPILRLSSGFEVKLRKRSA